MLISNLLNTKHRLIIHENLFKNRQSFPCACKPKFDVVCTQIIIRHNL